MFIFFFFYFREYPLFKSEKSTHDIADALLSLKHAVVHPQLASPLSPPSPPPGMPHLGAHYSSQGLNPCGPASPGPQTHQQGYGTSPGSHMHGQSVLHASYGVGVGVGMGLGYTQQYDHCPSPPLGGGAQGSVPTSTASSVPSSATHLGTTLPPHAQVAAGPPPPHPHVHPHHAHPSQAAGGMAFPSMSVNVSMSMNVGMTHSLGPSPYNYGPPSHQQWPPQPSPAQPASPPPQFHPHHHHNLHHSPAGFGAAVGVTQYSGYVPAQQTHVPMSAYPAPSPYPISTEIRASGDSR
jgi:hypothetical protein